MSRFKLGDRPWAGAIELFLYYFSLAAVPLAIATLTVFSLYLWTQEPHERGSQIALRAFQEAPGKALALPEALPRLRAQGAERHIDTRRSEVPFWFSFVAPAAPNGVSIELPSRHAVEATCWDPSSGERLGSASRHGSSGSMIKAKAGFALRLGKTLADQNVVCRGSFIGPARISALSWDSGELHREILSSARSSGLLDGGMGMLAAFVLMIALINREALYVVFFAWIMMNLRLAALSAGWDSQWLGNPVPVEWLTSARQLSLAAYYIMVIAFFSQLFKHDLKKVGNLVVLRALQWSAAFVLAIAVSVPYQQFLPIFWGLTCFNVIVLSYYLALILRFAPSRTALWFTASFGVTLFSNLNEVIAAALGAKGLISSVNSVTAALFSSFLAALAIAEQLRQAKIDRKKAEEELSEAYQQSPIGLFTLSKSGAFLRGNPALHNMLPIDSQGLSWRDLIASPFHERVAEAVRGGENFEMELEALPTPQRDGKPGWFLLKCSVSKDKIEGSLQDITERVRATDQLRFLADHDPLTGSLNRRGLLGAMEALRAPLAGGEPISLAYLDLDRFKLINDLYGHDSGDQVLREVHARARAALRERDILARIGGDEFVVVMPGRERSDAEALGAALLKSIISEPFAIGGKAFRVRASIGMVEMAPEISESEAISAADQACREGRREGSEQAVYYARDAAVFKERQERLRLMEPLGAGEVPPGLFLVMQPIMSVKRPFDSLNFEVLLRMRKPDGSVASAWSVISMAESNGRIALIDRWVLSNTLQWIDANYEQIKARTKFICVNLSGGSLNDERFTEDAFAMLAAHPKAAAFLCLEVTESVAILDLANMQKFIAKAKTLGPKIAIDDFGAGYSSFSYLKDLPANVLKIDGAFVKGSTTNPANLAIVSAIARLASDFGMHSVAEWAEDLPTIKAMAELEIDYLQGFCLAKPMLPEELLKGQSSADFITDPEIAEFVRLLGAPDQIPISPSASPKNLH